MCRLVGSGTYTASTSGSSKTASYDPYTFADSGNPFSAANLAAFSWDRLPTAWRVELGERIMAREILRAISAQPKIPKLIGAAAMVGGDEMWGGGEARVSNGECNFLQ